MFSWYSINHSQGNTLYSVLEFPFLTCPPSLVLPASVLIAQPLHIFIQLDSSHFPLLTSSVLASPSQPSGFHFSAATEIFGDQMIPCRRGGLATCPFCHICMPSLTLAVVIVSPLQAVQLTQPAKATHLPPCWVSFQLD